MHFALQAIACAGIGFIWEESHPIFTNGGIVGNESRSSCTYGVGDADSIKPLPPFVYVGRTRWSLLLYISRKLLPLYSKFSKYIFNKCSSLDVTHNGTRLYSIPNKCSSYTDNEH